MCYHGLAVEPCGRSSGSCTLHALLTNERMIWHGVSLLIKKKPGERINDNQERKGRELGPNWSRRDLGQMRPFSSDLNRELPCRALEQLIE